MKSLKSSPLSPEIIEERKSDIAYIQKQIRIIDDSPYGTTDYKEREALRLLMIDLYKDMPYEFEIGDEVFVKVRTGKAIKAKVKEKVADWSRSFLLEPIDNLYKEPFIAPDSLISAEYPY